MHGLYDRVALVVPDPDPSLSPAVTNAMMTALAVVLMQSLLDRYLDVSVRHRG